jgi:hypothetical protein
MGFREFGMVSSCVQSTAICGCLIEQVHRPERRSSLKKKQIAVDNWISRSCDSVLISMSAMGTNLPKTNVCKQAVPMFRQS